MKQNLKKYRAVWITAAIVVLAAVLLVSTLFAGRVYVRVADLTADIPALPVPTETGETPESGDGWVTVAQSGALRLEWDAERVLFRVVSADTGAVWESGYDFEGLENYSKRNRRMLTSLLQINYLDELGEETSLNNAAGDVSAEVTLLEGGMTVTFLFEEPAITVPLQLYLEEGGLTARIPQEQIKEESGCRLLSVDVLPAFGAILTGDDGFLLYPDGCGAIMDGNTPGKRAGIYTKEVYAARYDDLQEAADARADGETGVPLPYYGSARTGKQAFIAYIRSGAENARVNLSIGGDALPINRLYTTAIYRYSRQLTNSQGTTAIAFSADRELVDYRVHFCLLAPSDADYSAMARTLRQYLQSQRVLPDTSRVGDTLPVTLEWMISVRQNDLFRTGNLQMTDFEEVDAALKTLESVGVTSTRSLLLGWQKEGLGIYPLSVSPAASAGGSAGLRKLLKTADGNRSFFLETDYVQASSDGHFNKRRDAVTDFLHTPVCDAAETRFLLNPLRQYDRYTRRELSAYTRLSATGLAFGGLGLYLPTDYAGGRMVNGSETAAVYAAMLGAAKEKGMTVAAQTGAAYLLSNSDYIYDAYELTSGAFVFTREVPFYQMLLHGLIPYTGTTPGNMSADFDAAVLRWAEYGCDPYFLLTAQSSSMLKNAVISDAFNSRYTDWTEQIAAVYADFNDRLRPVAGAQMLAHTKDGDVATVRYANGYIVAVNYGAQPADTAYGTVPAKSYAVFRDTKEGNE